MQGGYEGALLVTGWAGAPLLATIGNKHLVFALRALDSRETLVQVAAL
jgi:hypothetical protein